MQYATIWFCVSAGISQAFEMIYVKLKFIWKALGALSQYTVPFLPDPTSP